jgi:hypothetical protein
MNSYEISLWQKHGAQSVGVKPYLECKFIKVMKFYENLFIAENRKALGGAAARMAWQGKARAS